MTSTALFDFHLPDELIARYPAPNRGEDRMMTISRVDGKAEIHPFSDIIDYLQPGDALICNDTKVLHGRMFGRKINPDGLGGKFELLLVNPSSNFVGAWDVLIKPGKRAKVGVKVALADKNSNCGSDYFEVIQVNGDGSYTVKFSSDDIELLQQKYGYVPLPPYLERDADLNDEERYQTVYAQHPGAVAAPTAGLHFTEEVLKKIEDKGIKIGKLTLHVGPGTFQPVSVENAEEHHMHYESFILSEETAKLVNDTHKAGKRVLAIGTTTVRVLESCVNDEGIVIPQSNRTNIFLYPPYKPKAVDMLLTNFHLPKSTLLMLVSCFANREQVLAAYDIAIANKMHFYSYGDSMLFYL